MPYIFDIKRFAINDGPGIRTTIFMKGCPLRCVWCHNPEGIDDKPVKLYVKKKCIGCSSCVDVCPQGILRLTPDGIVDITNDGRMPTPGGKSCLHCGKCTDECPTLALEMAGKEWMMKDVMEIVEKERKVMEDSGGGVTICGGEPLMHTDYLIELLTELKCRGLHCTVDTTLFASAANVQRVMELTDLFLIDLKQMDEDRHRLFTGVTNETILDNIRLVSGAGKAFWIRIPLIVGVNADNKNLEESAKYLASLPNKPEVVNLLAYHDIGKGKHERMGTTYNPNEIQMDAPDEMLLEGAIKMFEQYGLNVKIGG